jgi:RHS repeat-associated protein
VARTGLYKIVHPHRSRFTMRRYALCFTVLATMLAFTVPVFAQAVLFGPKSYTRTAGPPNEVTDTFTLPSGTTAPYTLHLVNGNPDGTKRVSSATVTLNGAQILSPSDFNQNVAVLDRTVTLQAANTLTVRLTSAPGSVLILSLLDTSAGTQPTALTPNPLNLNAGATGTLTATLVPVPTAAGALVVASGNPAVATVPASVSFAAGQTSVPFTVTAVASGSTSVTVTLNGASAASQVTVTPPPPTITSFTPTSGHVGDTLTISGTNFINVQTVTFNGVGAIFTIDNATTLTAVVPTGATTGKIAVTDSAGTAQSATDFIVLNPVPILTLLVPASMPSGSPATTVTLTGHSFVTGATVKFGTTALTTTVVSATSLTAVIPSALLTAKGTVPVTVENPAPGGGVSNSLPFTIENRAPVLAPIGNQTVPLGSTVTFTATATDPDNDPVTFAVTPLPLSDRATFNSQTGQFIFTPLATQVGTVTLTFIATDGIAQQSETVTVTVTGAPVGGVTGVSGRVVDGSGQPIANLPVSVKGTLAATTTTNAQGQFTLNNLTVSGRQILLANGFAQGYAILASPVDLIPNVLNQLPSELRVPALDMASAVTVNPNATTVLGNPNFPAISVTIPPHTAKNPDGTDYTGVLTISPVPEYGRPESRPVELKPGFSITIQPAGITLTTPVPITLPNTDNLPTGNELDLWSLSPDTGTFYVAGRMKVSADRSRLEMLSGGVRKTAWHFALPPAAMVPNEKNRIMGGCTQCAMASNGDLTEGTLTQDLTIPGIRTLGISRNLTLHYTSTTADVRPILPVSVTLPAIGPVPPTFSVDLTVGGLIQGIRGVWDASVMDENVASTTRMGVQFEAAPFPTGRYSYGLGTYSNYPQTSIGAITTGNVIVRNERASPVGAGWTLSEVDRIVLSSSTALLARGSGQTIPYVSTSTASLVSWWPADGTVQDLKSGNNGLLQGGAVFSTGQRGQSFLFNGTSAYIIVPHNPNLDPVGSFTVAAWIKTSITGASQVILQKYECGDSCPATATSLYQMAVTATGQLIGTVRETGAASGVVGQTVFGNRIVADGLFHHVAFVRGVETGHIRLYVDGQLDSQVVLSTDADGQLVDGDGEPDPFIIGAGRVGGLNTKTSFFAGAIDEVEVYTRALPAAELEALFTAGGRRDLTAEFLPPPSEYSALKRNLDGSYVRTLKDGTITQFNAEGYQTAVIDRNGNQTTYAYNGSNQLTTITDPVGKVTTLAYSGTRLASIADPAGRVTTVTHDSAGNLIAVESADQSRMTFQYDAQHRMVQKRDAQGQVYAYQFDFAGRLKKAVLPNGDSREIRPTEIIGVPDLANGQGVPGNPAPISQPPVIQATFKDAKGQTTRFETDAIGRVTKQIDPLNRTTLIERDPQGNPTKITRPNNAITTMTYDAKGNLLTSTEQSISATTTFLYELTFNQVTRITDPRGNQTNITYDAKGNPLTITDADNKVTTFTYNLQGLLLTTKDALNQTSTFTYDALGRLLTTTDPLNRTTTLTYDVAGNVATSKDALNRLTTFEYDVKNRLNKVIDPLMGETVYTYDGNGNLLTVKDAKNQITTFAYDSRNRLLSTTDPLGKIETYDYDANDNLTKHRTPKGDDILFAYDPVNQLLSKTLPGNQLTSYQYDLVGNVTSVTDPDSVLTMTYDQANRLRTTNTAGAPNQPAVTVSYSYDKNGNRVSLTDPSRVTTYQYDRLNRLTQLGVPAQGNCPIPTTNLVSHWLADGTAADSVGTNHGTLQNGATYSAGQIGQAFAFDGVDDSVSIANTATMDVGTGDFSIAFWVEWHSVATNQTLFNKDVGLFPNDQTYLVEYNVANPGTGAPAGLRFLVRDTTANENDLRVPVTLNPGQWYHVVAVRTGSTNRLYLNGTVIGTQVAGGTMHTGTAGVAAIGKLALIQDRYVNGLLDDIMFYSRALTQAEIQGLPCTIPLNNAIFAYDALSRRTAMTLPNGTQTTYTYDPASQVTNILHQLTATSTQINQAAYAYNPVGNRTSLTDRRGSQAFGYDTLDRLTSASHPLLGTPQAFAYDPVGNRTTGGSVVNAGNQLTADATYSYQYDDNGNLTRKTLLATGNYTQHSYDAENRLIKVEDFTTGNPTAFATSMYRYDGLGRRIEKVANGQTKRYVYDGEDILLEYDGANVLQARYTHGPDIDEPIAVTKGSSTFFYHQDGLGTVTDLTDSAGATAKSYAYDAYGTLVDQTGTLDQPYTYTGRELDTETGLYYYRARHYDPSTGRFLQQDPGSAGINSARLPRHPLDLVSQYVYAADNPIHLIDPLGDEPQEPGGVGVEACKYYDDVARANGCKYHPYAREYCDKPSRNPCILMLASAGVIHVIRQELIIEDQKARIDRSTEACDRPGCATAQAVAAYHKKVFAAHGIPEWCFPSWWLSARGTGDR